jgi:cytochrome b pre-mRNA-processing protein 3
MPFRSLRDRRRRERSAHQLYTRVIHRAREQVFYLALGVPDSLDGRFDLVVLHAVLMIRRLKSVAEPRAEEGRALAQQVFDLMFADMDQNLREIGVTDTGVSKRVKQMVWAFYGRAAAYEDGLAKGGLEDALARNLYGTVEGGVEPARLAAMAAYVGGQAAHLAALGDDRALAGELEFGPLPKGVEA